MGGGGGQGAKGVSGGYYVSHGVCTGVMCRHPFFLRAVITIKC